MKALGIAGMAFSLVCFSSLRATELDKLKLLYIGEPTNSTRAKQVRGFLEKNVAQVKAVDRHAFAPEQAEAFDVVVLDWPQSDRTDQERQKGSPLGRRSHWHKPTVLLGSAGLNQAIVWKVRGGSG
jgi:hypothetical protein